MIRQFADAPVAAAFVKFLRALIEMGDAQKNIRALAKNSFFRKLHELVAKAAIPPVGMQDDGLDVAVERAVQKQDQRADDLIFHFRDVDFA